MENFICFFFFGEEANGYNGKNKLLFYKALARFMRKRRAKMLCTEIQLSDFLPLRGMCLFFREIDTICFFMVFIRFFEKTKKEKVAAEVVRKVKHQFMHKDSVWNGLKSIQRLGRLFFLRMWIRKISMATGNKKEKE